MGKFIVVELYLIFLSLFFMTANFLFPHNSTVIRLETPNAVVVHPYGYPQNYEVTFFTNEIHRVGDVVFSK